MDEARAHVMAGNTGPCWFMADEQTGGRGRHGRTWISPPGNLYATLALTAPCEPAVAAELGFVAGLALHRAVAAETGLGHANLAIKWPNDLLLDGAKVAGLLLEGLQVRGRFCVLIGFGMNIVSAPTDTAYPAGSLEHAQLSHDPSPYLSRKGRGDFGSATALASSAPGTEMANMDRGQSPPLPLRERVRERGRAAQDHPAMRWNPSHCGKMIDYNSLEHCVLIKPVPAFVRNAPSKQSTLLLRDMVLATLSQEWLTAAAQWRTGFAHIRADWLAVAHGIGTQVRVRPPTGEISGIMRGIDARGCLLLDTAGGEVTIDAGDLFFGD